MQKVFLAIIFLIGFTAIAQAQPDACAVSGTLYKGSTEVARRTRVTVLSVTKAGELISTDPYYFTTETDGTFTVNIVRGSTACLYGEVRGLNGNSTRGTCFEIPDAATANLKDLVPVVSVPTTVAFPSQTGNSGKYLRTVGGSLIWATVAGGGGGSGTVEDFTAGNLSPLFTSNVANSTTTPALTFSLSTQTANRVLAGPTTGSAAAPTFRALVVADIPDLSATYAATSHTHTFSSLTSKPTTLSGYGITDAQGLNSDLTAIAGLSPTNDDVIQRKAGVWVNRSIAQLKSDFSLATIATSGSASDLGSGTVPLARLSGITTSELSASAGITNGQLAGSIAISKLSITGTPNGSKYLRDDGSWQSIPGGGDALVANPLSQFAATSSAQFAGVISDETGTGAVVLANSPTLVTPALGTPSSATLTNATGLPISTGLTGAGTGVLTALAVNVGASGAVVVNGGALGTPSSGTLTNATGLPISTGVSGLGTGVATALATPSSANLASAITDETGSGALVFGTSPTIAGGTHTAITSLGIRSTGAAFDLTLASSEVLTAGRTLTIALGDAARTLTLGGNATLNGGTHSGTNTGDQTTVSGNAGTATALQTARTIGGVSFDGTANITVATATGGFTVSGGALALGANDLTMTGSLAATGARATKGWFTDVESTNMPTVGGTSLSAVTATLTNKTLTAPKIADAGFIADANGNEQIIFTTTASAVNEVTFANAATGGNPKFTASGGDTNVGIDVVLKGTGNFNIKGNATQAGTLRLFEATGDGTNYTAFKVGAQAGDVTYTLPTADGSSGQVLSTNGSGTLSWASSVTASSTDTFTNKTYDVEGTGNSFSSTRKIWIPTAGCNNTTAATIWDLPASSAASATCRTPSANTQRGLLDFASAATSIAFNTIKLPSDWVTGNGIDGEILWQSTSTSGDVVWEISLACAGDGDADDVTLSWQSFTADTAKGTANLLNSATKTNITTTGTCAAGDLMTIGIRRQGGTGSDTLTTNPARMVGLELTYRNTK